MFIEFMPPTQPVCSLMDSVASHLSLKVLSSKNNKIESHNKSNISFTLLFKHLNVRVYGSLKQPGGMKSMHTWKVTLENCPALIIFIPCSTRSEKSPRQVSEACFKKSVSSPFNRNYMNPEANSTLRGFRQKSEWKQSTKRIHPTHSCL